LKTLELLKEKIIAIEKIAEILNVEVKDVIYEIKTGKMSARILSLSGKGKGQRYIISLKNFEKYINNSQLKKPHRPY
jgi:hypothetical protein